MTCCAEPRPSRRRLANVPPSASSGDDELGDGIYTIAIALETLRVSDHASTLAYVETARVAPNALLLLFAGALMQMAVPAQILGRASSVDWLFSICLSPLGVVFAGALASSIGVRATVHVGAAVAAASWLVVFVPGVRDPDRPDYAPSPLPDDAVTEPG